MDNKWINKRSLRSVSNLHLWKDNPRLDPADTYISVKDFVNGMFYNQNGKVDFMNLAKSIVDKGFLSFDPIVVWKGDKNNFIVAEGNRRVAILKMLLEPQKAPKSIRRMFVTLSHKMDLKSIEKIPVCVAPSFQDCIWYINQRHEAKSTQKMWGRENYMTWINTLWGVFEQDIDKVQTYTGASRAEIYHIICFLKLKEQLSVDLIGVLSENDLKSYDSPQFPITTFERVVKGNKSKQILGLEFDKTRVLVKANYNSMLNAFATLIHRMLLPANDPDYLDSRKLNKANAIEKALKDLPSIQYCEETTKIIGDGELNDEREYEKDGSSNNSYSNIASQTNNPSRSHLIPENCKLGYQDDFRLCLLFKELKQISVKKYPNVASVSLRVILDLAVKDYIEDKGWNDELRRINQNKPFDRIELKAKINFLNSKFTSQALKKITGQLVVSTNQYSLDTLNGYVHGSDTYMINAQFINAFWDFLYPLMEEIIGVYTSSEA